jgi:hypothetical protein
VTGSARILVVEDDRDLGEAHDTVTAANPVIQTVTDC